MIILQNHDEKATKRKSTKKIYETNDVDGDDESLSELDDLAHEYDADGRCPKGT